MTEHQLFLFLAEVIVLVVTARVGGEIALRLFISEDNAYSSSVSEPVSGGTTAQTLKSCWATMMASRTKTSPPRSQ